MIKKVLKTTGKILFGIVAILIVAYLGFRAWEFITGNNYVKYLNKNHETVSLNEHFTYEILNNDIESNNLILVGEVHGFKEPTKFDFHFFKYLNSEFEVRIYFAEFDYVQSLVLNEFLNTGDKELLNKVLKNWVVEQGRNNKDYYEKYLNLYKLNKQLPENKKFKFIGVDKIQDIELTIEYLNAFCKHDSTLLPIGQNEKGNLSIIKEKIKTIISHNKELVNDFGLIHILKNIEYKENKENREDVLFKNFESLYKHLDLSKQKVYGYFGLFHVLQYKVNNNHTLASMIRTSNIIPENKLLSITFSFVDSKMVMESSWLPSYMRSKEKYTKFSVSYDNIFFVYLYGINDFKRITKEYSKSIIKLNGKETPYHESNRLTSTIQILPFAGKMDFTDKGKEYVQYNIFVRNSEWAEPME